MTFRNKLLNDYYLKEYNVARVNIGDIGLGGSH